MDLHVGEAVDDVHAGLLERARPLDVAPLVEARLQLDDADALLAVLGRLDQRRGERRVVARPVDGRLQRRHGRIPGGRAHERLDARRERVVRVLDDDVARRRSPRTGRRPSASRGGAACAAPTARTSGRGGRGRRAASTSREVEEPVDRVDRVGSRPRAAPRAARASRCEIELETSSRTTAPNRRLRSSVSTASSRSSASSEISVSPSRVRRNAARSVSSISGKSQPQEVRDHGLERDQQAAVADRDEARQASRAPSRARSAPRPSPGRAPCTPRRQREPRDVRERLARARPRAASAPGRSGVRTPPRARRARLGVASSTVPTTIPSAASAGTSSSRQSLDCAAVSSSTRSRTSASACCGVRPSGERTSTPRDDLVEQAGDPDHEELVEVRREDRAELDPLEQRLVGVGGEVEDALVQVEPRQLAVEQGVGREVGRGSVRGRQGADIIPERWCTWGVDMVNGRWGTAAQCERACPDRSHLSLIYRRHYAPPDAERPPARRRWPCSRRSS